MCILYGSITIRASNHLELRSLAKPVSLFPWMMYFMIGEFPFHPSVQVSSMAVALVSKKRRSVGARGFSEKDMFCVSTVEPLFSDQ